MTFKKSKTKPTENYNLMLSSLLSILNTDYEHVAGKKVKKIETNTKNIINAIGN